MFHNGRKCCRDDNAGKHGLVEVADQFFQCECDRGDGCVEGSGDAGCHANRGHAAAVLRAQPRRARHQAADAGADLHGRSFKAQRTAGADLECAEDKFADSFAQGDESGTKRKSDLHLGNAGAGGGWSPVGKSKANNQATHDPVSGSSERSTNSQAHDWRD